MTDHLDLSGQLNLTGQRALVTGAAGGIGSAVARLLAGAGAHVILADIADEAGQRLATELGGEFRHLDVSDPLEWELLAATFDEVPDIAFLNAGVSTRLHDEPLDERPLGEVTERAYRRIMGANVDGVVYGARAVLGPMVARGSGHIVITASIAGLMPIPFDPVYGLTKHAVIGFAKSLGVTYGPTGVCTSAICPGFADTGIITDQIREMLGAVGVPIMSPTRVADAVAAALTAREPGSIWAVWGDLPITRYIPNPVFPELGVPL